MMTQGTIVGINVASAGAAPLTAVKEVRAVAGRGLEGDRYFLKNGSFSKKNRVDQQATFIESEAVEALQRDYQLDLTAGESRRNIVTRGVALNHLVGQKFRAGGATFRGVKLCEPCGHLEGLTKAGVMKALLHRGGLRCEILSDGLVRVGDSVGVDPA